MCVALCALCLFSCAKRQTPLQEFRSAIRKTLSTQSYRVVVATGSRGEVVRRTISERHGKNGRVLTGSTVRGVFVGPQVYIAAGEGGFVQCTAFRRTGSRRTFDTYTPALRAIAETKRVVRRGDVFTFRDVATPAGTLATGSITVDEGRVKVLKISVSYTGSEGALEGTYRFSYVDVPPVTPPPPDLVEVGQCP